MSSLSNNENTKRRRDPEAEYRGPVADAVIATSAALTGIKTAVDLYGAAKGKNGKKEKKKED